MSDFSNFPDSPVRVTEEASTFSESDVNISKNKIAVNDGSLAFGNSLGTTADRTADDTTNSRDFKVGVAVSPNTNIEGVKATISSKTSGATRAYLIQLSNATILDDKDISSKSAGDTVDLIASLSSSLDYAVVLDAEGSSYTTGRIFLNSSPNFTSADIDIVAGATTEPGGVSSIRKAQSNFQGITDVTAITQIGANATSADAVISFDGGAPKDIVSYDLATFQRTLDGETATIDIEDANGNVLKSDISKDTDISDIATSTDVQLRANLSRNDTANNPTVDYLARRFTR